MSLQLEILMKSESGEDGWWRFLELSLKASNPKMLNELYHLLLTHDEREEIAGRYLIVKELVKGEKTQREMAQELHVSIAKITRGSNCLKEISPALRAFLEKQLK